MAARFGNAGQTDYSAANDLLCKITSSFRRHRPRTRALAIDWTAWGGIGMATRGSIPKIMEMAGVEVLPPEAGVAWIRRELTAHPFRGEVVAAGALGRLAAGHHPTGGLDPVAFDQGDSPFAGEVEASLLDGVVVRTTLDPAVQPFLDDHRIDGTPVLPGVMGMEAFAEVARLLVPEWYVVAVEDVDFLTPVKFYRDEAAHPCDQRADPARRPGPAGGVPSRGGAAASRQRHTATHGALHRLGPPVRAASGP